MSDQDAAAVRVFPPAVPLLAILLGAALGTIWPIRLGIEPSAVLRYSVGGAIVLAVFLGLGLWSVILVRRSGQRENPWKPTSTVITTGPFRVTRNPMYLQMVVGCLGFGIILWSAWIVILTPVCAWVLQRYAIVPEEEYLEEKFGDIYRDYKRRVRRWI